MYTFEWRTVPCPSDVEQEKFKEMHTMMRRGSNERKEKRHLSRKRRSWIILSFPLCLPKIYCIEVSVMKKVILALVPAILISCLTAVTFSYDGVIRTRAALYNDMNESTDGRIDNRLRLGMNSELAPKLNFRTRLQFGNVTWGDANAGGGINSAVRITAYELYLDYLIETINTNVRFGQQYWADPMGLIIDGSFSGLIITLNDLIGFKTELGLIKGLEAGNFDNDNIYFLLNMTTSGRTKLGLFGSVYHMGNTNDKSVTVMPHVDLKIDPVQIKATAFMGAHLNSTEEDQSSFGTAIKAKADLGLFSLGANVLVVTESGIATLFPYYLNGLYIYGYGLYHDGVNLYWNTPYSYNTDTAISAVGSISIPLNAKCNLFGAAGFLKNQGIEVNAGFEHEVVPKKMKIAGYAAVGRHEITEVTNFVVGTSVVVPF